MPVAVNTNQNAKGKREPHAGINSSDQVYQALVKQIERAKCNDIVQILGRGQGSNTVRFACAVAAEVLSTGHRVVLNDSELTVEEPATNEQKPGK